MRAIIDKLNDIVNYLFRGGDCAPRHLNPPYVSGVSLRRADRGDPLRASHVLLLIVTLALTAACSHPASGRLGAGPASPSAAVTRLPAPEPFDVEAIRNALVAAGLKVSKPVRSRTAPSQRLFGKDAETFYLKTRAAAVQVFAFATPQAAEKGAKTVSKDGCGLQFGAGYAQVEWVGAPHFFVRGRLVVLYLHEVGAGRRVATDMRVLETLDALMGRQFAGMSWPKS